MNEILGLLPIIVTVAIPVLAAVNIWVYLMARRQIARLEKTVYPKSDRLYGVQADLAVSDELCKELRRCSSSASMFYGFFANITAVFPLMGILGTVVSLMNLSGTDDLASNFSSALWTTFLGLIGAIVFKLFDAGISSRLERALDESDYIIHRHNEERRAECEKDVTL